MLDHWYEGYPDSDNYSNFQYSYHKDMTSFGTAAAAAQGDELYQISIDGGANYYNAVTSHMDSSQGCKNNIDEALKEDKAKVLGIKSTSGWKPSYKCHEFSFDKSDTDEGYKYFVLRKDVDVPK